MIRWITSILKSSKLQFLMCSGNLSCRREEKSIGTSIKLIFKLVYTINKFKF